ncbi:hypothetical protein BaRGS_00010887 [Batillaria attramentaria]|uniref:Ig-like domain-containing protein n=1 Tax=Batillaria attramentaria TaxID=370345 RepID=A0ABD0LEA1_9CAEN
MSRGFACLWLLALVHLVALVVVSVIQQLEISKLGHSETELHELLLVAVTEQDGDTVTAARIQTELANDDIESSDDSIQHLRRKRQLGYDAILADMLRAQERVIESHCTNGTKVCVQGPKGERGAQGPQGQAGAKGTRGITGPKGDTGPVGAQGAAGATGATGPRGPKGDGGVTGAAGATGDKGPQGPKGDTGLTGEAGTSGPKGEKGAAGAAGPRGPQGPKGAPGAAGPKGVRGHAGVKGVRGDAGLPGDPGTRLGPDCECLKPPKITDSLPTTVFASLGDPVSVTCRATGNPAPTVTWSGRQNPHLVIDSTINPDFKDYTCTATNPFGTDTQVMSVIKNT